MDDEKILYEKLLKSAKKLKARRVVLGVSLIVFLLSFLSLVLIGLKGSTEEFIGILVLIALIHLVLSLIVMIVFGVLTGKSGQSLKTLETEYDYEAEAESDARASVIPDKKGSLYAGSSGATGLGELFRVLLSPKERMKGAGWFLLISIVMFFAGRIAPSLGKFSITQSIFVYLGAMFLCLFFLAAEAILLKSSKSRLKSTLIILAMVVLMGLCVYGEVNVVRDIKTGPVTVVGADVKVMNYGFLGGVKLKIKNADGKEISFDCPYDLYEEFQASGEHVPRTGDVTYYPLSKNLVKLENVKVVTVDPGLADKLKPITPGKLVIEDKTPEPS